MRITLLGFAALLAACSGESFTSTAASAGSAGTGGTAASGGVAGATPSGGTGGSGGKGGSAGSGGSSTGGVGGDGGATGGTGGAPCGGADLQNDAKNCGECGHDCIETSCTKGECGAKVLVTGVAPKGLAINGTTLYFADDGASAIKQVPSDGSGPATVFASGQTQPKYLTTEGGKLYWTRSSPGALMVQTIGSNIAVQLTGSLQSPLGVGVSGSTSYVAEEGTGKLVTVPAAGGSITTLAQMVGAKYIEGLATDGQTIWVGYNLGNALVELPMNGASESPFATGQGGPSGVAVDSNWVYWANQQAGEIWKKQKSGGSHATLKTGVNWPVGVAVDAKFVYYAEGNSQRIARVAK